MPRWILRLKRDIERSVLILFAHPSLEKSRVHAAMLAGIASLPDLEIRDLYERYPDYDVEVDAEQEALLRHETVLFQHPLYWYSVPPLLKQWIDLVLEYGWAYGRGGDRLRGKRLAVALSSGGPEAAYRAEGSNRYTIEEMLRPIEATAHICGMTWTPPFVVHGAHRLSDAELEREVARYQRFVVALSSQDRGAD